MADSQSLSPTPESQSREDIEAWLEARSALLTSLIQGQILEIISEAFEAFILTVDETAVTAAGDPSAVDSIIPRWNMVAASVVAPAAQETFLAGSLFAYGIADDRRAIPRSVASGWAKVINQQAAQYAAEATNRLRGVGDTLWKDIRGRVTAAIETGASGEALKQEIETLAQFSEFRADTIGRTETSIAYSNGNFAADQALGEYGPAEKIWVAVGDARTRATHLSAMSASQASPVPFGEPFSVGGVSMMFPHAPGAPAGEVVNCRCFYEALYIGDRRPDGSIVQKPTAVQAQPPSPGLQRISDEQSMLPPEGSVRGDTEYDEDEAKAWSASLTKAEDEAILDISTFRHEALNRQLREGEMLSQDDADWTRDLDRAIAKAPQRQRVTYRGVEIRDPSFDRDNPQEWISKRYKEGDIVDLGGGYAHTSTSTRTALMFTDTNAPVVYEIESVRGAPIKFSSRHGSENEVLLSRRGMYEVVRIEDANLMYDGEPRRATLIVLKEVVMP